MTSDGLLIHQLSKFLEFTVPWPHQMLSRARYVIYTANK